MGSHLAKPSNKSMVDRLVEHNAYIQSPTVESVFRAVDRAMYFDLEEGEVIDPYENDPWRRGNLHLSAPSIYAKVVEALELKSGLSFLNLGSGTGYLNTMIGLLVGPNGINHGIELHPDVVDYAYKRLQQFKEKSHAIDKFDFSEPVFIRGNCLNMNPNTRYDRIYLGAACLPDLENFMKKMIKPNGGILVMPYENHLMRYIRVAENEWRSEKLMDVNFTLMIRPGDDESMIDMPLAQAKSLKEMCRIIIRQQLRDKTNQTNPSLLYSDNIGYRRLRKARAERDMLTRHELRSKSNRHTVHLTDWLEPRSARPREKKVKKQGARERRCCCWQYAGDNLETAANGQRTESKSTQSQPGTSDGTSRIMTRSASRRFVESRDNRDSGGSSRDKNSGKRHIASSSRGTSLNEYQAETSSADDGDNDDEFSGHDTDDNDGDNNDRDTASTNANRQQRIVGDNNEHSSARTRPFLGSNARVGHENSRQSTVRNGSSLLTERFIDGGPPALLPLQRQQIVSIMDPPYEPSSPSFSDSYSESDLPSVEEYDYVGRQVILSWPGFLGLHRAINPNEMNIHGLDSSGSDSASSGLSSSLDSSDSDTTGLEFDEVIDSSDDPSSWGESILGGFSENGSLAESSILGSDDDEHDNDRRENSNSANKNTNDTRANESRKERKLRNFRNLIQSRCQILTDALTPRPGPSTRNPEVTIRVGATASSPSATATSAESLQATSDQEPVASRLRSKQSVSSSPAQPTYTSDCGWACKHKYQPKQSPPSTSSMRRPKTALHCPIHGPYSNAVPTDPLTSPPRLVSTERRSQRKNHHRTNAMPQANSCLSSALFVPSSGSTYNLCTANTNQQQQSSSLNESGDDSGSYTSAGRTVLISSALGTTLTLASPPNVNCRAGSSGSGASSRLFEHRSVRSGAGRAQYERRDDKAAVERRSKRKRRSSPSDSSGADAVELDELSSSRASSSVSHCRRRRQRRLAPSCDCSSSGTSSTPTNPTKPPRSDPYQSRSFACQTSYQASHCTSSNFCNPNSDSQSVGSSNNNSNNAIQGHSTTTTTASGTRSGGCVGGQQTAATTPAESAINQTVAAVVEGSFCLSPTQAPSGCGQSLGRCIRPPTKECHDHRNKHCHHQHRHRHQLQQQQIHHHHHHHHHHHRNQRHHHHNTTSRPRDLSVATGASASSSVADAACGRRRRTCMVFGGLANELDESAGCSEQHQQHRTSAGSQLRESRRRQPQPQQQQQRSRKRKQRRESECDRYHNYISAYIRQLPLPRVLHSYLNYDRSYVTAAAATATEMMPPNIADASTPPTMASATRATEVSCATGQLR